MFSVRWLYRTDLVMPPVRLYIESESLYNVNNTITPLASECSPAFGGFFMGGDNYNRMIIRARITSESRNHTPQTYTPTPL